MGKSLGEGGDVDLGGVDGGEGNRVGRMEEGEEGSAGAERGKNTRGWMGETGEGEDWDAAGPTGAEGERQMGSGGEERLWADSVDDSGEGQETGEEGVVQGSRVGGQMEVGSADRLGAGESSMSGGVGSVGETQNSSKLVGAGGRSSMASHAWLPLRG